MRLPNNEKYATSCAAHCMDNECRENYPQEICLNDDDCGGKTRGKCERITSFTRPFNRCYCAPGYMGKQCEKSKASLLTN